MHFVIVQDYLKHFYLSLKSNIICWQQLYALLLFDSYQL